MRRGLPSTRKKTQEQYLKDSMRIIEEYEQSQLEKKYVPPTVKKAIEALQRRMKLSRQQLHKLQQEQKKLVEEESQKTSSQFDILLTPKERELVTQLEQLEKQRFDLRKKQQQGTLSTQESQELQRITLEHAELQDKLHEKTVLQSGILGESLSEKIVRLTKEVKQQQEHLAHTQQISHDFKIPVKKDSSGQSYIELILEDTEHPAKKDESGKLVPQEPDVSKTQEIRINLPLNITDISASQLQKLLKIKDGKIILSEKEGMQETFTVAPEELEFHGKKHPVGVSFSDFVNEEQRELQRKYQEEQDRIKKQRKQDENRVKRELAETLAQEYGKPINIDDITSLHLIDREEQLRRASTPFSPKEIFKTYDEKGKEVKIKIEKLQKQVEEDRGTDLYTLQKKLLETFQQRAEQEKRTYKQQLRDIFARQIESEYYKNLSKKQQEKRIERYRTLQQQLSHGTIEAQEEVKFFINEQNQRISQIQSQPLPFAQRIIRVKSAEKDERLQLGVAYLDKDTLTSIAPISLIEERPISPKRTFVPHAKDIAHLQQELYAQQQLLQFLQHPEQQARRYRHRSIPRTPLSFSSEQQLKEYINDYIMPAPRSDLTLKSFIEGLDSEGKKTYSQLPETSYSSQGRYIFMLRKEGNTFEVEPLHNPQYVDKEKVEEVNKRIQYYTEQGFHPVTSEGLPFSPQEEAKIKQGISKEAQEFQGNKFLRPEEFQTTYPALYGAWSQEVNYMKRADVPKALYSRIFTLTESAKKDLERLSKQTDLTVEEKKRLENIRNYQPEYIAEIKRDEWDRYMNTILSSSFRPKKPGEDLYDTQPTNAEEYRFLDMSDGMLYPRITQGITTKSMANLWKNHVFKHLPPIEYTTQEGTEPVFTRETITEGQAKGGFRFTQDGERVVKSGRIPISPFETLGRYIAEDELKIQKIKQAKYMTKALPNTTLPEESDRITLRGLQERALRTAQFKLPFAERLRKMKSFFKRSHEQQVAINAQERGKLKLSQLMKEKEKVESSRTFSNKMKNERIERGKVWSPMKAIRKYLEVLEQRKQQRLQKVREGKYVRPGIEYVQDTSKQDKYNGLKGIQIPLKKQYDEQVSELDTLIAKYPERTSELQLAKQKLHEKYLKRQKEVSQRKERKEFSIDDKLKRAGFSPEYIQPLGSNAPSQAYKDMLYVARHRKLVTQQQKMTEEQFLRHNFSKDKNVAVNVQENRLRLAKGRTFSDVYFGSNLQDIMNAQQQGVRHAYTEGIRSRSFTPVEHRLSKISRQQFTQLRNERQRKAIEDAPVVKSGYRAYLNKDMREKRHKEAVYLQQLRQQLKRENDVATTQQLQDKLHQTKNYRSFLTQYKQQRMKPVMRIRKDYYDIPENKQRIDRQFEDMKSSFINAKQEIYQRMKDRRIYKQAYIQEKIQERKQQFQQRRRRKRVKVKQGLLTRIFKQYKRNKQRKEYQKKRENIRKLKLEQRQKYVSRNQFDAKERALKYVQGIYTKKMKKKQLTEQEKIHYKMRMNRVNTSLERVQEQKSQYTQRMNTPSVPNRKRY